MVSSAYWKATATVPWIVNVTVWLPYDKFVLLPSNPPCGTVTSDEPVLEPSTSMLYEAPVALPYRYTAVPTQLSCIVAPA